MIYKIPKKNPIYHRKMLRRVGVSGSFPEFFTDHLKKKKGAKDRKEEELLYVTFTKLPRLF